MSVSVVPTFERSSVPLLRYIDMVLVLLLAVPVLAAGAPALGYTVGAAAWILVRLVSLVADRRLENVSDVRSRLALGVAFGMVRVWVLAGTIVTVGLAGTRADGLTVALVIFGAFSVFFACSAIAHVMRKQGTTS
ncbi:MAG: hypothetical protein QOJ46_2656 [bacterium]